MDTDKPGSKGEDNPGSKVDDNPGSKVDDNPGSKVEDNPGSKVEDNPGSKVEDNPGSKVEDIYITDWIALENILASSNFDKSYLANMENDNCEQKNRSMCIDTCEWYTRSNGSKCVSKSRIKKYNQSLAEPPNTITGRNGQTYKIIDAKKMDNYIIFGNNKYAYDVFYFMFQSVLNPSNIYVIFGSGGVHEKDEFKENPELRNFLTVLVDSIHQNYS